MQTLFDESRNRKRAERPEAAAPYLKKIRQRAFSEANWPKEVEQYVAAASVSKETMFNAIIDERAFEFCGE